MNKHCLIEIGTEELPPKALKALSQSFAELMQQSLQENGLAAESVEAFATPRRLALLLRNIPLRQADQMLDKRGPALQAAYDAEGKPSKAAQGFASSCGVSVDQLTTRKTDKGAWLYFEKSQAGQEFKQLLPELLNQTVTRLPIPKRMRWGDRDEAFVRPVKWLVMMVGDEVIEGSLFGVESTGYSYGHRFHVPGRVKITQAEDYENRLLTQGLVMVNFEQRENTIQNLVKKSASRLGGVAHIEPKLLEEVAALVEYPAVISGEFDESFLTVPQEALVTTMQDNQKYFAVFDQAQKLLPYFITISNVDSKKPEVIVRGNERVIRPRFADAQFFFEKDKKQPLSAWRTSLDKVVFQAQLGSIGEKVERITQLSSLIAQKIGAEKKLVKRAADLCKCDLMSDMVGEFPKLQGVMGRYYAMHDQQSEIVCDAIEQHYWPKFAGDSLPENDVAVCLALADRLDSLVGIFAIGQRPSGVKDPFALRRAALAVVRIIIEKELPLDLRPLCEQAVKALPKKFSKIAVVDEVLDYILDRLKAYYQDQQISFDVVDAVIGSKPTLLHDCDKRVQAVFQFQTHEAAPALAAANKRIANILKKQPVSETLKVDKKLLSESAEKQLAEQINRHQRSVTALLAKGEYLQGLQQLAELRPVVDLFFDEVMVMVDDDSIKNNRLALLNQLLQCFRQVADFSRIQS